MSAIDRELFFRFSSLPADFRAQLDRLVEALFAKTGEYDQIVREFVNASAGAVSRYLPNGATSGKIYSFVKTDASANAVTIYPIAGQYINGGASTTLTARGDKVTLVYDLASQSWWNV